MRPLALLACTTLLTASEPVLTVYNGGFAVVRDRIPLVLGAGAGVVSYPGASAHVEPGTALLAVPVGVRVLEHTYRNDPVSVTRLLQLFAGQTIDIETREGDRREVRKARIVRAPAPVHPEAWQRFGQAYAQRQQALWGYGNNGANEVLLEIDGQLRFGLPGTPLFPALPPGVDLRPTLEWQVRTAAAVKGSAEVSYLCDGMRWEAAYTLVSAAGDEGHVDLNGMLTVENESGTDYLGARLKFVAGDVRKLSADAQYQQEYARRELAAAAPADALYQGMEARATGKEFSDYHLYTMPDPVDLRDRETKQLGFIDVHGLTSRKQLVYDGLDIDWNQYRGWNRDMFRTQREFGTAWNPKVVVERVIANDAKNQLGRPLPAGVMRCYLRDADGRPEFIGEDAIDHTPDGETLRIRTGAAFDVVGERTQVDFATDSSRRTCDETYRITLRNHGAKPLDIQVVEHLYRWVNWEIRNPTVPFTKRDSRTIELPVTVPAQGETTLTYQVHYSW